jgi:uncharacterized protein YndB with AHSA1/START domain
MSDNVTSKDGIVIERTFDAPIDIIWQLWTQPEHFKHWYGPKDFTVPVAQMDVRVGGKRLLCMEAPDGNMKMWLTGEYTEVTPINRLVYTESMADENGNVLPPSALGLSDDTPVTTIITVLLEDLGGRTKMLMTHTGVGTDEVEAHAGWEQALDELAEHAATVLNVK